MQPFKLSFLCIAFVAFVCFSFTTKVNPTDFSGTWIINKNKIEFGQAPEWVLPKRFSIQQEKDRISIERVLIDEQLQEHPYTEKLAFDGSESQAVTYNKVKKTSSIKWSDDGGTFVLSSRGVTEDNQPGNATSEKWSLEDNGQTLLIERSVQQADGFSYSLKAYYDKQK